MNSAQLLLPLVENMRRKHGSYTKQQQEQKTHQEENNDPKGTVATDSHWQGMPTWARKALWACGWAQNRSFPLNASISGNDLGGPSIPALSSQSPKSRTTNAGLYTGDSRGNLHHRPLPATQVFKSQDKSSLPLWSLSLFPHKLKHWVHNALPLQHWLATLIGDLPRSALNSLTSRGFACSPTITLSFQAEPANWYHLVTSTASSPVLYLD